jgi:hypothetical protein
MKFILTKDTSIRWPVRINMPVNDGKIQKLEGLATFDILNQDEYDDLIKKGDYAFLSRVVTRFDEGFYNEDNTPLICDEETKQAMFKGPAWRKVGFITAYHEAAAGLVEENVKPQPNTGQMGQIAPSQS